MPQKKAKANTSHGAAPIAVGGDHTIPLPIFRGMRRSGYVDAPIAVRQEFYRALQQQVHRAVVVSLAEDRLARREETR